MVQKKINKSFWYWIILIAIIILLIYLIFNMDIFNSNKIEDYQDCVEDCIWEHQDCIFSLSAFDCADYLEECIYYCEPD